MPPHIKKPASIWRRYAKTRNWFLATCTAIATVGSAWIFVEPAIPAHRGYVRDTERTILIERIIVAQLDVNRERRERLLRQSKEHELELHSSGAASLPQYKQRIQESIDRAGAEIKKLDESDKSLFDEQKKR